MNSEATNVDHTIKVEVCMATMKPGNKGLEPRSSAKIAIRNYLKENPSAKIKAGNTTKEMMAERKAAKEGFELGE